MELNFDTERSALQVKKAELLEGVAIIDEALAALDRGNRQNGQRAAAAATGITRTRKPMSAKAKAAASKRMKAYWAARRKAER
jgi:hypothetical protein